MGRSFSEEPLEGRWFVEETLAGNLFLEGTLVGRFFSEEHRSVGKESSEHRSTSRHFRFADHTHLSTMDYRMKHVTPEKVGSLMFPMRFKQRRIIEHIRAFRHRESEATFVGLWGEGLWGAVRSRTAK